MIGHAPAGTPVALEKGLGDNYADYTTRTVADQHSFVVIDADPGSLTHRTLDAAGDVVDRVTVTRPSK